MGGSPRFASAHVRKIPVASASWSPASAWQTRLMPGLSSSPSACGTGCAAAPAMSSVMRIRLACGRGGSRWQTRSWYEQTAVQQSCPAQLPAKTSPDSALGEDLARRDQAGDHAPWNRLAASQLPEPGRGPDDDAEPATADIPAAGADVGTGELSAARVRIEVWDAESRPPAPRDPGEDGIPDVEGEGGRGLFLVTALSACWDWYLTQEPAGKVVWCELEAERPELSEVGGPASPLLQRRMPVRCRYDRLQ